MCRLPHQPSLNIRVPAQVHFTFHHPNWPPPEFNQAARNQFQMSLLFMHMANLGYGVGLGCRQMPAAAASHRLHAAWKCAMAGP